MSLKAVLADLEKSGMARTECNRLLGRIKRAFRWAASEELVPVETYRRLRTVDGLRRGHTTAPEPARRRPITDQIIEQTLPHLTPVVRALVQFQRLTGCRPKEACWLRPCDLDRAWRTIDGVVVWLYSLDQHKTDWRGAPCWIPIGPKAQEILKPFLEREPDSYCFSPAESRAWWEAEKRKRRKTKVQPSQEDRRSKRPVRLAGKRYTTMSYSRAIRRACLAHDIPPWSPNQLRKRLATEVQSAHDRDTARCVLRHSEPAVTARYADDLEKAAKVIAVLG